MLKRILLILFISNYSLLFSQKETFSRQDSLRGSITKERAWWNLLHYDLSVKIYPKTKNISGFNTIEYEVLKNHQVIQIDLQNPMQIISVKQNSKPLSYTREGNVYFINLTDIQNIGDKKSITIYFEGKPIIAQKAPWDGGFVWGKDKNKNDFIANANQGVGASVWWPCKDNPADEPELGATIRATVPKGMMDVSNGRLKSTTLNDDGTSTYQWEVTNPINSYAINTNIAHYSNFSEIYQGEKGSLDCNYYVLNYNLIKAKNQFKQVPKMLKAFEHWFGPYPFYEDSYKLVEAPYLGMEHQSSITYGNGYKNGYLGGDLSGTGWGLKFDFIIVHESGHEWFANNITNKDVADMWIHESFTTYSEILYLDYHFGTKAGNEYLIGYRDKVLNDKPIIGQYQVNNHGSNDMYIKGAAMIHTLRQIIDDEEEFRSILRGMNKDFYHQTVTSEQIENYWSTKTNRDLEPFFDQYLRTIKIPKIKYKVKRRKIKYKFKNIVKGFSIPVKVTINNETVWIHPSKKWKSIQNTSKNSSFKIDPNFYIEN